MFPCVTTGADARPTRLYAQPAGPSQQLSTTWPQAPHCTCDRTRNRRFNAPQHGHGATSPVSSGWVVRRSFGSDIGTDRALRIGRRALRGGPRDSHSQIQGQQRDVIALAYYGEFTHVEIAAHLDLPLGTVKGRMRLGIGRLRGDL